MLSKEGKPAKTHAVSFFGQPTTEIGSPQVHKDDSQAMGSVIADDASLSPKSVAHEDRDFKQTTDVTRKTNARRSRSTGADENGAVSNEEEMSMDVDKPEEPVISPAGALSPFSEALVVDADGDVGMTEPPVQDMPSPIFTLSKGQSVGVQIAPPKAADLTPETTLVDIPGAGHVTKTCWRPNDPLTLVAAGDAFCGMWKLPGQRASTVSDRQHLVESVIVTAFDWDQAGQTLAVATYRDYVGTITTFDRQGNVASVLPDAPRLVTGLRWASRGSRMAVALSDGNHSSLAMWDQDIHLDEFPVSKDMDGPIYDITWSRDGHFYACGDGSVYQCQGEQNVEVSEHFSSEDPREPWDLLKATSWSGDPVAVVASTSTANIWIPTHDIAINSAHHGGLTALDVRPSRLLNLGLEKNTPLTLATASMDHTIKLWSVNLDAKEIYCTHRLFLGESSPALAATFSPDGYAIAAASQHDLLIWHAERGGTPLAKWTVPEQEKVKGDANQVQSTRMEESDSVALDRPLSWDSDGKKLAFGFGQKVPILPTLQRNTLVLILSRWPSLISSDDTEYHYKDGCRPSRGAIQSD